MCCCLMSGVVLWGRNILIEYPAKGASKIRKVMTQMNCVIVSLLFEEGMAIDGTTYRKGREGRERRRREKVREGGNKERSVWGNSLEMTTQTQSVTN